MSSRPIAETQRKVEAAPDAVQAFEETTPEVTIPKPGVEGIRPGVLGAVIVVGLAMWGAIISFVRWVIRLIAG